MLNTIRYLFPVKSTNFLNGGAIRILSFWSSFWCQFLKRQNLFDFSQIFQVSRNEAEFSIPEKKTDIEHQITKLLSLSRGDFLAPFLYQSSISRSGQCDNNFVIWCSISVFFSGIKNSASFLDTWKIWEKSKKLCRFKNWHQIEDQRERILIVPPFKS